MTLVIELEKVLDYTPIRKTVPIDRVTLNQAIARYRSALQDPTSDPLPPAQQLYAWLLQPLEEALQAIEATNWVM